MWVIVCHPANKPGETGCDGSNVGVTASKTKYVPSYAMALVNAGLNERDAAFEWLNRAYVARDGHLIFLTVDPKWDPFRPDPRFDALLARCGFSQSGDGLAASGKSD